LRQNRELVDVAVEAQGVANSARAILDRRATGLAAAQGDAIITQALRPALTQLLAEVRSAADALADYPLGSPRLYAAPAATRKAAASLPELVSRYRVLRQARAHCNSLSGAQPEHAIPVFTELRRPEALVADWDPDRPRRLDADALGPADPTARLVWLVGAGAAAEPWMPTTTEADQRWLDVYGDPAHRRRGFVTVINT
jgi:hypothetical protein